MPIGIMLHVLALVMLPFQSLEPLLIRLKLRRIYAALILCAGFACALLEPIALYRDLSVSMRFVYCFALALTLLITESKHRIFSLLSAILSGILALCAKIALPQPSFEPGLLSGLLAALGAFISGRHLKLRLSGALLGPILAHIALVAVEFAGFGYVSPVLGGGLFFDEASISLFLTCFASVVFDKQLEHSIHL